MQILKIFITGLLFCLFGLICIIGNVIFMPIILLRLQKFRCIQLFCRFFVRYSWRLFIFCVTLFGYCKSNARILDSLGKNGEIIICNHPSLLDVVFFLSFVKNANCIVKGELAKNIFLCNAIKACGYILNTENEECLEKSCQSLQKGESLIVFPEGSRTRDSIILHKAASYIAIKAAKTLNIVFLHMNPRSLKKGQSWYQTPNITIKYTFRILEEIQINTFYPEKSIPLRARMLNNYLQEIYNKEFCND